jgi:hypothetical protein
MASTQMKADSYKHKTENLNTINTRLAEIDEIIGKNNVKLRKICKELEPIIEMLRKDLDQDIAEGLIARTDRLFAETAKIKVQTDIVIEEARELKKVADRI